MSMIGCSAERKSVSRSHLFSVHVLFEEDACCNGACKSAPRILHVGNRALDQLEVAFLEWQPPDLLAWSTVSHVRPTADESSATVLCSFVSFNTGRWAAFLLT